MRLIALEEHFTTQALRDANEDHLLELLYHLLAERGHTRAGERILRRLLDLGELRLQDMDAAGIDVQVLSHTAPCPENLAAESAVRLAAEANDAMPGPSRPTRTVSRPSPPCRCRMRTVP
ncbi:hypothetical protein [Streptomyces ipomoeae]|uniref:hypothetical protein n=1 Tax=Streptomyces ipomoeae TaxID=103232 RepID=UPI0015F0E3FA|nr:hypothetical protein [Streptomyces ipomoeae]MDX2933427.1 hypothetical protein [Streptomyces ipomoeae]